MYFALFFSLRKGIHEESNQEVETSIDCSTFRGRCGELLLWQKNRLKNQNGLVLGWAHPNKKLWFNWKWIKWIQDFHRTHTYFPFGPGPGPSARARFIIIIIYLAMHLAVVSRLVIFYYCIVCFPPTMRAMVSICGWQNGKMCMEAELIWFWIME